MNNKDDIKAFALIFGTIVAAMVAAMWIAGWLLPQSVPSQLGGPVYNAIDRMTVSSSTVSATSTDGTIVLAGNPARQYAVITNTDANDVYCSYGATSTLATFSGEFLDASGGQLRIDADNLWRGQVSCYSEGGTSGVSIVESQ